MAYPDPNQVNRTTLLREIRDAIYGALGYKDTSGTYQPGGGSNTVGGTPRTSQGGYFAPATGSELANRPSVTSGVRFELNPSASITYYVAPTGSTYTASPAFSKTVNVAGTTDEPLSGTDTIFVTALSGTVIARWVQR